MADPNGRVAVVSLASAPDAGAWLDDFLPGVEVVQLLVDEHHVEEQVADAPGRAWVSIDQRLMGYLCLRVIAALEARGTEVVRLVHADASVSPGATLGPGCLVAAGAVVSAGASVGAHSRVWERAVLSRGAQVGAGSTIEQGCVLGEGAIVGDHCWVRRGVNLDAGARVAEHCEFHVAGTFAGEFAEGHLFLPGLDGPARIHRFG